MRIGLLIVSLKNFGEKKYYNAQEIGLAKALRTYFEEVRVYKLVSYDQLSKTETLENYEHLTIQYIPSRGLGVNGKVNPKYLDITLDALLFFSDTQLAVPKVYRWTKKYHVKFIPYIGVIESHSRSRLKRLIINVLFKRNIMVYKKCICLAKTPEVASNLKKIGVKETMTAPVGLDVDILKEDYKNYDINNIKRKYGYQVDDRILLFIGRMVDEKQPGRMIKIFSRIAKKNKSYKLLMVGNGHLKKDIMGLIQKTGLVDKVQLIESIPNRDIWQLYRIADSFINLNQVEIFGMAILEAMYYECKVIAWRAPGPDFIIEDGISGWLIENDDDLIEKILDDRALGSEANKRIVSNFSWDNAARMIKRIMEDQA